MERGITKQEIITALTKSVHAGTAGKRKKGEKLPKLTPEQQLAERLKKLQTYDNVGQQAVALDPLFFSKLIVFNHHKGEVRDAKVALPVIGLAVDDRELLENALAHLADLRPREFLRATEFARARGHKVNVVRRLVERYLRELEAEPQNWARTALLHKRTIKSLYTRFHVKPCAFADEILFKGNYSSREGRLFEVVATLRDQLPEVIESMIRAYKLPWMVVRVALGSKLKDPGVLAAVIGTMTATELVTNMGFIDKTGLKDDPLVRAALNKALGEAGEGKRGKSKVSLKASVAAAAVTDDTLAGKLQVLQEKQLDTLKGIEGNWLICADKSSSMTKSIEVGKQIAGFLARMVKGQVHLVFFNDSVMPYEVTGKTLAEIETLTRHERATGGTNIGAGLEWATSKGLHVDGIVIVSDGGENQPGRFAKAYERYVSARGTEPTVYFYKLDGDPDRLSKEYGRETVDMEVFDLRGGVDYTSLPNLVQTMKVGKFTLLDEIMSYKLRTLNEVLDRTAGQDVLGVHHGVLVTG